MRELRDKKTPQYVGLGLVFGAGIGAGFGITLGQAVFGNPAIGISVGTGMGVSLGIVFGAALEARQKKRGGD